MLRNFFLLAGLLLTLQSFAQSETTNEETEVNYCTSFEDFCDDDDDVWGGL